MKISADDIEKLNTKAFNGDSEAAFILASCYEIGHEVPQNIPKAIEFYQKAIELGYKECLVSVTTCSYLNPGIDGNSSDKGIIFHQKIDQDFLSKHHPSTYQTLDKKTPLVIIKAYFLTVLRMLQLIKKRMKS